MIRTYIIPLLAIAFGCTQYHCVFPGDPGQPVMAYELHGTWCTKALPVQTCLIADRDTETYIWYVGDDLGNASCSEAGRLSGGLEFWPDTDTQLCLAPEYDIYSAAGEWTATGLRLIVDTVGNDERAMTGDGKGRVLELDYVP